MTDRAIVFGASGALGAEIAERLAVDGIEVVRAGRHPRTDGHWVATDGPNWLADAGEVPFSRVVFAQGMNAAGGLDATTSDQVEAVFDANVLSVVRLLKELRGARLLARPARVCILGSVWSRIARADKTAYVISKSAVSGLVRSLCADLSTDQVFVNALLPGVVDSPMTREFLDAESLDRIVADTPSGRLVTPEDVANGCAWLTSAQANGISGQSIVMDFGWSVVRRV